MGKWRRGRRQSLGVAVCCTGLIAVAACGSSGGQIATSTDPLAASDGVVLANFDISGSLADIVAGDALVRISEFTTGEEFESADGRLLSRRMSITPDSILYVREDLPGYSESLQEGQPLDVYEPRGVMGPEAEWTVFQSVLSGVEVPSAEGSALALLGWAERNEQAERANADWGLRAIIEADAKGQLTFPGPLEAQLRPQWRILVEKYVPSTYASELELLGAFVAESNGEMTYPPRQGTIHESLAVALEGPTAEDRWYALPERERPLDSGITPPQVLDRLHRVSAVVLSDVASEVGAGLLLTLRSEDGVYYRGTLDYDRQAEFFLALNAPIELEVRRTDNSYRIDGDLQRSTVADATAFGSADYAVVRVTADGVASIEPTDYEGFMNALQDLGLSESIPRDGKPEGPENP